ncbi:helix-turn-helix domain-containing protein [Roseateles sp. DJS-2-20]|jgi:AraC-like DNA-binding protein|uniref:Helix-turn-helix domain-containing protein n=2 Tax=Roseateles paludis TaxID=3145238 RepID=A0ABV0G7D2_9BURK
MAMPPSDVTPLSPLHDATRLWLPPLRLAGCVRAVLLRDTRGWVAEGVTHATYWPASPYCSLHFLFSGDGDWLATPGFVPPNDGYRLGPCLLSGPFTGPTHMHVRGATHGLIVMFMLDAFQALTGIAPEALQNRCDDALGWLPADWQPLLAAMAQAPDDAARLAVLEDFVTPRWQALRLERALGLRLTDWVEALAVRAATSSAGRSLRQFERRVKAWAGLPLRELRAASRAEAAFLQVAATQHDPGFEWAGVAADAGYADQSHLCRETRRLTGFSPEDLRRRMETDEAFWAYRVWR